jgi:hypothetical protein
MSTYSATQNLALRQEGALQKQLHLMGAQLAFLVLVAYCAIGAAAVCRYSARLLDNTWENSYFESPQTYAAIYAAKTGKLYIPMSQPPYTPQAYTPLYYAINAATAKLAHLDLDRFVIYARWITFIAYLLSGLMVYYICGAAGVGRSYSLLAGLMALGQPDFTGWNVSPRPDTLYLLAMLVSLFCAAKWAERKWLGLGLSGFLAGVAFLIKQPGLAVAAAIFSVLLVQKRFKSAAVLVASTIAPIVLVFSILYWRRDPFLQQIAFVGNSLWSLSDAARFARDHLFYAHWLVPAGVGILGFSQAVKMGVKAKMIAAFAFMNWLMALATLPQVGGYLNYLLPGLTGSALMLPYAIQLFRKRSLHVAVSAIIGTALILAASITFRYSRNLSRYFPAPTTDSLNWLCPFRVLSDLTTMNVHGREPNLLDPFGAHVLELTKHWDPTPVVDGLSDGDYDLIILTRVNFLHIVPSFRGVSYFSPAEIDIINRKYEVLCSTLTRMVLKPRGRDIAATPEMFGRMFNQRCGTGYRERPMDLKLAPGAR